MFIMLIIFFLFCTNNELQDSALKKYNIDKKESDEIELPSALNEISGLAVDANGRLFAHNDEKAVIFEIDPTTGLVKKKFFVGKWWAVEDDFEGIAIAGENFYLATSSGNIFEFMEGDDDKMVDFILYKTGLSSKNNVEGLCYDGELNALLVACKEDPGKGYKDERAVYRFSLKEKKLIEKPLFTISLKELKKHFDLKNFFPSGIDIHPVSKTFFVISSKGENAVIEISRSGEIIAAEKLPGKIHRQPEGISFLNDNTLVISNEASGKKPNIVKYTYKK